MLMLVPPAVLNPEKGTCSMFASRPEIFLFAAFKASSEILMVDPPAVLNPENLKSSPLQYFSPFDLSIPPEFVAGAKRALADTVSFTLLADPQGRCKASSFILAFDKELSETLTILPEPVLNPTALLSGRLVCFDLTSLIKLSIRILALLNAPSEILICLPPPVLKPMKSPFSWRLVCTGLALCSKLFSLFLASFRAFSVIFICLPPPVLKPIKSPISGETFS